MMNVDAGRQHIRRLPDTLSPKSHPKEAAPAPMKRRTIATQTTQTKEITYD